MAGSQVAFAVRLPALSIASVIEINGSISSFRDAPPARRANVFELRLACVFLFGNWALSAPATPFCTSRVHPDYMTIDPGAAEDEGDPGVFLACARLCVRFLAKPLILGFHFTPIFSETTSSPTTSAKKTTLETLPHYPRAD
ncbi:hypothetical protein C8F04DRAFT_1338283 [Mycena alexandri]|uniref:Uncharacterized protein n=1 Tax=Mycena alexandri TaxID=1745969 RepID=A0AAD6SYL5_9AGAR|nr:hypothetical protein C8F04DRAFT_1338283 [Mycena alexandri]